MRYIAAIGALAGATLLGSSAFAADLYTPAPVYEPVAAAPAANYFEGPYIGLHGGWGWGDADASYADGPVPGCTNEVGPFPNIPGCAVSVSPDGAFVGGQLGWNFVFGSGLMLGIEGDYSFANLSDKGEAGGGIFATHADFEVDQMATVLARVGWVMGRWMPFIAGGWGWAHADRTIYNDFIGGSFSADQWHDGWALGGGVEYAINDHWTLKGEYRYFDGGSQNYSVPTLPGAGTDVDLTIQTVRFGVNYNF